MAKEQLSSSQFYALLDAMQQGNRMAAERFVRKFLSTVRWQVFRQVGWAKNEDQEDILWEVMAKLVENNGRRLQKYDHNKGLNPEGWVKVKARGIISNMAKKPGGIGEQCPTTSGEDIEAVEDEASSGDGIVVSIIDRIDRDRLFLELDAALTPALRGLFHAMYVERLTDSEVQISLGINNSALRRRYHRLCNAIKEVVQIYENEG